jgi:serine/threonine protein kinase
MSESSTIEESIVSSTPETNHPININTPQSDPIEVVEIENCKSILHIRPKYRSNAEIYKIMVRNKIMSRRVLEYHSPTTKREERSYSEKIGNGVTGYVYSINCPDIKCSIKESRLYGLPDEKEVKYAQERNTTPNTMSYVDAIAEASLALRLAELANGNRGIINTHAYIQDADTKAVFIIMETYACDFKRLMDNLRIEPSPKAVAKAGKDILLGLQIIHSVGYAHADLKPANIMLNAPFIDAEDISYSLKHITNEELESIDYHIGDFGNSDNKFKRGTFLTSPHYAAPEVLLGLEWGKGIDIWALGCLLFTMYTKKNFMSKYLYFGHETEYVANMRNITGPFSGPYEDVLATKLAKTPLKDTTPSKHYTERVDEIKNPLFSEKDKEAFSDLLKQCFSTLNRPTVSEILNHRFFNVLEKT